MPGIQHILTNPFLNATKGSFSRAAALGSYTNGALQVAGQPAGVAALYAQYHPVWAAYSSTYAGKVASMGVKEGTVYGQAQLLAALSEHIKEWALAIELVHRRGTPGYTALLPRGRSPFRDGPIPERISAVSVLAMALEEEPLLPGLQAEVAAFEALLKQKTSEAGSNKSHYKGNSLVLEGARIALCQALYAVLGGLINIYPDSPGSVAAYFDVIAMHRHRYRKPAAHVEAEAPATVGMLQQEGATA